MFTKLSHSQPVLSLTINPKSKFITAGSATNLLSTVVFQKTNKLLHYLAKDAISIPTVPSVDTVTSANGTSTVSYRGDGRLLAAGLWNNNIQLFQSKNMQLLGTLE